MTKLDAYFTPALNVFHQRTIFEQCVHLPGESVEEFVRKLHAAAKFCDFGDQKDNRIRDRLVAHILDRQVAKELQLIEPAKLTLTDAVLRARQAEKISGDVAAQAARPQVNAASRFGGKQQDARSRRQRSGVPSKPAPTPSTQRKSGTAASTCPWCGHAGSHKSNRSACPAFGRKCNSCGKQGHFAAVCLSTPATTRGARAVEDELLASPSPFMGGVAELSSNASPSQSTDAWSVSLPVCSTNLIFKIDTGADVSCITHSTYQNLVQRPVLTPSTTKLLGPSGAPLSIKGQFTADTMHKSELFSMEIVVIDGPGSTNLLSRRDCLRLRLIQRLDAAESCTSKPAQPIGCMVGPPADIKLVDDATPCHCGVARRVPLPLQDKVTEELARMEEMGIIVRETGPSDWCSPMVPVRKPNGRVRICVDLKKLNGNVKREHFPLPTVEDTLARLAGSTVFSTLDANSGFWQVPLTESASKLTTFITPVGRFRFLRMPFGITSAPEIFQRRLQDFLSHVKGSEVFMDDVLVHAANEAEHDHRLDTTRQVLADAGITLNPDKCHLKQSSVKYLGHIVSGSGVKPDPSKVSAIDDLKEPTNVPELRRALGLFTYVARFIPELATISAPLRQLLHTDTDWFWDSPQQDAFRRLKELVVSAPCLVHYDPKRPIMVSADASSYGIGGVLLQKHDGDWRPVAYASRSLTKTEQGYAQIEKECLAAVWTCERLDQYLFGAPRFIVQTDHKPLVPLINTRDLDKVPIRCQRMLLRFLRYEVQAIHVPGKDLVVADTLSRAPASASVDNVLQDDIGMVLSTTAEDLTSPSVLADLAKATSEDPVLSSVMRYVIHGWPATVPDDIKPFHRERGQLSHMQGVLCHGFRLVVPSVLQPEILQKLHDGHQGVTKSKARARFSSWWPGISADIEAYVAKCTTCIKQRHQSPEPLQTTPFPERPWQRIASDLCDVDGRQYLITVDYFSRYIDVACLSSTTSRAVITHLKSIFAAHGYPDIFVSDNGPQFASDAFAQFMSSCNITHRTSSPKHPQSNGEAERAVQTAKRLIRAPGDLQQSLLAYRSTPLANGYSPAELLYGRRLRTNLPCPPDLLQPSWPDITALRAKEQEAKHRQEDHFDQRFAAKSLSPLPLGAKVWVDDKREGTVVEQLTDRSYNIATSSGLLRRNRRAVKLLQPVTPPGPVPAVPPAALVPQQQPVPTSQPTLRARNNIQPPQRLIATI
ncbi:uncharacterized protein K02A2.6-like [Sycon ciliatum]|uniref:uncharacterized protein K02A2.6-like n=1 Tax=Sycon ciliatum TaxID=27933 RepID=UPI0031F6E047